MGGWRRPRYVPRRRIRRDRQARLLARLAAIGDRLGSRPGQEFRVRLRESLLDAHQAEHLSPKHAAPASGTALPRIKVSPFARIRPAGLVVALVAAMFAASWGTYRSVPGDLLYPLKRASESALLGLSVDDSARAQRELVSARTRASEAATLARVAGPKHDELLRKTIDDMDSTTRSAIRTLTRVKRHDDTRSTGELKRFAKEQRNVVEPMLSNLDDDNRQKADAYLHLIEKFEAPER